MVTIGPSKVVTRPLLRYLFIINTLTLPKIFFKNYTQLDLCVRGRRQADLAGRQAGMDGRTDGR